jgi:hypothetical protein
MDIINDENRVSRVLGENDIIYKSIEEVKDAAKTKLSKGNVSGEFLDENYLVIRGFTNPINEKGLSELSGVPMILKNENSKWKIVYRGILEASE